MTSVNTTGVKLQVSTEWQPNGLQILQHAPAGHRRPHVPDDLLPQEDVRLTPRGAL